ncbi:M24 family metallopeptidase [Candidatus Omnitrophota bacterium]
MSRTKSKREVECLAKAARITKSIFERVARDVRPGARESDIAALIEKNIKARGLKRSFKTIVASGPNGAKPHAKVTTRKIKKNDQVVIDFGLKYKGYCSDMTRTIVIGKASSKMKQFYSAVKTAQSMAIERVRPGLKIADLVSGAHGYLRKKGLGKYILHTLGHGVGRKIHESPKLSEKNNNLIQENMVVTIEPGLYAKGVGGVRIEDMILVGSKGAKVLTR